MYPVLIRFGPFTIHTYGFLLATAFLTALCLAVSQARKRGIAYDKIVDQAFYTLVAGLAGSRLFFVATNWPYYAAHPLDIVKIWEGGLVFYGGVLLALPTAVWLAKKRRSLYGKPLTYGRLRSPSGMPSAVSVVFVQDAAMANPPGDCPGPSSSGTKIPSR